MTQVRILGQFCILHRRIQTELLDSCAQTQKLYPSKKVRKLSERVFLIWVFLATQPQNSEAFTQESLLGSFDGTICSECRNFCELINVSMLPLELPHISYKLVSSRSLAIFANLSAIPLPPFKYRKFKTLYKCIKKTIFS